MASLFPAIFSTSVFTVPTGSPVVRAAPRLVCWFSSFLLDCFTSLVGRTRLALTQCLPSRISEAGALSGRIECTLADTSNWLAFAENGARDSAPVSFIPLDSQNFHHSYLSATIGSTLVARRIGQ